jgi:hypothetical protein
MKGALGMEHLYLKRLKGEGLEGGGGSFTGDPGRYVKKGSGYGHLSLHRSPFTSEGNLESGVRAHIPGTLNDE